MLITSGLLVAGQLALAVPSYPDYNAQTYMSDLHALANDDEFVPFKEHLERVRNARYSDYANGLVANEEEFKVMQQHILYMYEGVQSPADVTSFLLDGGYGDCIAIKEQPTYFHLGLDGVADPPKLTNPERSGGKPPGDASYVDSPLTAGDKDRFGNPISCPEGFIPFSRLTLEKFTTFQTLSDAFKKVPNLGRREGVSLRGDNPIHEEDWEATHLYAHAAQSVNNYGGNSWLNLWNPVGDFSISQQWYTGGSGCNLQTVEGGWQACPTCWGTKEAVLFIYWTNHDYNLTGCTTKQIFGCYNTDCVGFHQTNNKWFLGKHFSRYSTTDGGQYGFEMQWKLYNGNWWLWLKGSGSYEAIGYYPTSIYNGGQMSKQATNIDYGGEVARLSGHVWPQMGSGQKADKGFGKAAYQNTIYYIPKDESGGSGVWAKLTEFEFTPKCFTVDVVNAPNGGSWGTYFYFGGPGASSC
ncbi:MAG: hypothetical protein Q9167_001326 [Letrouitia subvulpina]